MEEKTSEINGERLEELKKFCKTSKKYVFFKGY